MTNAVTLATRLATLKGDLQRLTRALDRAGERFLSFSKVTTVESCEFRYLLEYVKRVPLDPQPEYFAKGSLFHEAVLSIEHGGHASADGECFKCPYRPQCPKARSGWY